MKGLGDTARKRCIHEMLGEPGHVLVNCVFLSQDFGLQNTHVCNGRLSSTLRDSAKSS